MLPSMPSSEIPHVLCTVPPEMEERSAAAAARRSHSKAEKPAPCTKNIYCTSRWPYRHGNQQDETFVFSRSFHYLRLVAS
jgi:hypothetical protein